jgi:hypothetical protein
MSKPSDYIPIASIHGITLWAEPEHQVSIYGHHQHWTFLVDGEGEKDSARELTEVFIDEMNQRNWYQSEEIREGDIYVSGRVSSMKIELYWNTKNGETNHLTLKKG